MISEFDCIYTTYTSVFVFILNISCAHLTMFLKLIRNNLCTYVDVEECCVLFDVKVLNNIFICIIMLLKQTKNYLKL